MQDVSRLQIFSILIAIAQPRSHLFGIWEITAQCDAWFSALYKYSYLLTYLLRFHSNLVQSFITWHPMYCKCSGWRVKGHGHSVT